MALWLSIIEVCPHLTLNPAGWWKPSAIWSFKVELAKWLLAIQWALYCCALTLFFSRHLPTAIQHWQSFKFVHNQYDLVLFGALGVKSGGPDFSACAGLTRGQRLQLLYSLLDFQFPWRVNLKGWKNEDQPRYIYKAPDPGWLQSRTDCISKISTDI